MALITPPCRQKLTRKTQSGLFTLCLWNISLSSKTETIDHSCYLVHKRKSYYMMLTRLEPKTLASDFLKGTCLKEKQYEAQHEITCKNIISLPSLSRHERDGTNHRCTIRSSQSTVIRIKDWICHMRLTKSIPSFLKPTNRHMSEYLSQEKEREYKSLSRNNPS